MYILVFLILWVASVTPLVVIPWGSDNPSAIVAWVIGWISFILLTAFGIVFTVVNVGLWIWHHVRLEVTF